jgi:superfamily II DNA or RNA helicase/DNA-binding XRE family transcriptional regulator
MQSSIPSDYPIRIKRLRAKFGLTQARMAKLIGVTPALVSLWENERASPSQKRWQQIARAEALGVHALVEDFGDHQALKEARAEYATLSPEMNFGTDPEIVRLVMQSHRLAYGHMANPTFATEISQIQPLPHQRTAVYKRMLQQPRLRFLLADDAGAGKTIMAGLYIREMLSRRLVRRVLVIPPAGLVGNWKSEMHTLFSLPFREAAGSDAKDDNPFVGPESDLIIVSVDTLAGERMFGRLQEPEVEPYDLVIFDEAHKLSAHREPNLRVRKTNRYRLAEALAGASIETTRDERWRLDWSCHHLLLLTATPHMGKDFPYYCLWRLLEPEALATHDAFNTYPAEGRRLHFIRRTKEEMVDFDGNPIYPKRISNTLSYALTQGPVSEQRLYDETTQYMETYYNRARMLNRSAARLAMSVFQRRLASSTYALFCSMENRLAKLEGLIEAIHSGEIAEAELEARQRSLDEEAQDLLDETTADEEESVGDVEQHEVAEDQALGGTVAVNLAQLEVERQQVIELRDLAKSLYENPAHEDSKFAKLLEVLQDPDYENEKLIIFTEHRDTMAFLVRRLEQLGYTGEIAQIHGGIPYKAREAQVEFFRKPVSKGGARYLVATDAAGEGINLQFCWLMVNYDVPWNPARLEQRMGRIHRYGQKHDPVIIVNLVAGKTREGRVIKTLLEKLEAIGREIGHDKVFDVVGRLFEGISIKAYMEQALTEEGAETAAQDVARRVTRQHIEEVEAQEKAAYGEGDDPRDTLPQQQEEREIERYRKLLPGYVRRFIEGAAPLMDVGIEGDLNDYFTLRPEQPGALDLLWPVLEAYPAEQRERLTVHQEKAKREDDTAGAAIFIRPGEQVFDRFAEMFSMRFAHEALQGSVFVDPTAEKPYLFHLARVEVARQADPDLPALAREELLESCLVGLRQDESGQVEEVPVEHLLLLRGGPGIYGSYVNFAAQASDLREHARAYVMEHVAENLAQTHRADLHRTLQERLEFVQKGYDFREAELAEMRKLYRDRMQEGDKQAKADYERVRAHQKALTVQREVALAALSREPELIVPKDVTFLTHALAIPSEDAEDRKLYDMSAELVAVQQAIAYEEALGAVVKDVSTPELARAAGLEDNPGFDLLSWRPDGGERAIEVKGRAQASGKVELSENEWIKACNHQNRYWLYVVYGCATPQPRLWRVQNPFAKQLGAPKGGWVIDKHEIVNAAEE